MMVSPTLPLSNVPRLLGEMEVDLHLLEWKKENRINSSQVSRHIEENVYEDIQMHRKQKVK